MTDIVFLCNACSCGDSGGTHYCQFHSLNILDPVDWKLMVCVVGCLNIAVYGQHKP